MSLLALIPHLGNPWGGKLLASGLGMLSTLLAQAPAKPPPPIPKNYMIDYGIVVVLCGLALFVICRPSDRRPS